MSARERGITAAAELARALADRAEADDLLVELAAALAEPDLDTLSVRVVALARMAASATIALFQAAPGATPVALHEPGFAGFSAPPRPDAAPLLGGAFSAEEPVLVDDIGRWAPSAEGREPYGILADGSPVCSWLALPVRSPSGARHGVIMLGHPDAHRFDVRHRRVAAAMADHLAVALDKADLYAERDRVALALQETLLPPVLPSIPGLQLAARYRPTGAGNLVGGDFYDVLDVGGGDWAIVVGDVSGFGPEAAAITGQARYTVRALARDEASPAAILRTLNGVIGDRSDERFCTAVYLRLRPTPTGVEVVVARGGHPPPYIVRAHGAVESVEGVAGLPLGLFDDAALEDTECTLADGDAIVLYTDGVIEARDGKGEQFDDDGLSALLRTCYGRTADGIARRVELAAMDFQGGTASDDVAIVVVRAMP
jgi:sigma-B regulation protein RsbU (phosphoserine phosphatase)